MVRFLEGREGGRKKLMDTEQVPDECHDLWPLQLILREGNRHDILGHPTPGAWAVTKWGLTYWHKWRGGGVGWAGAVLAYLQIPVFFPQKGPS